MKNENLSMNQMDITNNVESVPGLGPDNNDLKTVASPSSPSKGARAGGRSNYLR